uniref:Ovule protein n=1 Tax=Haemonchus contortus TaxID=6289 RepID=A0A7I4YEJ4_HAECO
MESQGNDVLERIQILIHVQKTHLTTATLRYRSVDPSEPRPTYQQFNHSPLLLSPLPRHHSLLTISISIKQSADVKTATQNALFSSRMSFVQRTISP